MTRRVVFSASGLFVILAFAASRAAVLHAPGPAAPRAAQPAPPSAQDPPYDQARARASLHRAEAEHGAESIETARAIGALVASLRHRDRTMLAEARALAERAVRIREKAFGPRHPEVARALNEVAELLWTWGTTRRRGPSSSGRWRSA